MKKLNVGPVIDGKELKSGGAGFFQVVNPATGQGIASEAVLWPGHRSPGR